VARALSELEPQTEVLYVGRLGGLEARLAAVEGLQFVGVPMRGIQDEVWRNIPLGWSLPASLARASQLMGSFRPQSVLGTGGYVTVPVGIAASLFRRPLFLQEQNAAPGRATRLLARRARAVLVAFGESAVWLKGARTVVTGTPVRPGFRPRPALSAGLQRLLAFGGSQGAHRLNVALAEALKRLLELPGLRVTHVSGAEDYEWLRAMRSGLEEEQRARYLVEAFRDDMQVLLQEADLVLARAGGSGLAEMTAVGLPMILVPYPHARGHQRFNALPLAQKGAAVLVEDDELSGERLHNEVLRISEPRTLAAMAAASRSFGRPDAAREVAQMLLAVGR